MPKYAFVDTETTGLDPDVHRPWEIAVILRDGGPADTEYVWQLRPELDQADPEALKIARFHERCVTPAGQASWIRPDGLVTGAPAIAVAEIRHMLDGAYLVGAVPSFDAAVLTALFKDHAELPGWRHRLICVENLVAGTLHLPEPPSLSAAAELVGITVDHSRLHGALYDARLARDVFDAVIPLTNGES